MQIFLADFFVSIYKCSDITACLSFKRFYHSIEYLKNLKSMHLKNGLSDLIAVKTRRLRSVTDDAPKNARSKLKQERL